MADLNIREKEANQWIADVQAELTEVRKTLDKVRAVQLETVGSDDTVFKMIEQSARVMGEVWTNTCNKFEEGWDILKKSLSAIRTAGENIGQAFESLNKNIIG